MTDDVPGINRMSDDRCSSHASATCIGVTPSRAPTADSVDDCSGVKPPSGKNSNVKGWLTWRWMLTAWAANGEQRGPFLAPDLDKWRTEENYRRTFDIHVLGLVFSMKHEIPAILKNGGAIVNTSSVVGRIGMTGFGVS